MWLPRVALCDKLLLVNVQKNNGLATVLCCEDLGLNSERLCGSLLEGDPRVVHQHVDPSVSEARLVVQGGAILGKMFAFANYVSCFVGHHTGS